MRANMSIMGAYIYDEHLFDKLVLPDEMEPNKELVVENLVSELAELELVHTNIDTLPDVIGFWSRKQLPVWSKLCETMHYEYNPIHNYDRHEEWHENRDTTNTYRSNAASETVSETKDEAKDETLNKVAGMNDPAAAEDGALANRTQTNGTAETKTEATGSVTSTSDSVNENEHANTHDSHVYGNIGVTTTQQMIQAQREVVLFNMIDVVIADFKKRFCLAIY